MVAMRTLVDLGDAQLEELDNLSKQEKTSRAALIRQAIDDYLAAQRRSGIATPSASGAIAPWTGSPIRSKARGES